MSVQRRCPECQHWNADEQHCTSCGQLLDPEQLQEARKRKTSAAIAADTPGKLDRWHDAMKYSRWMAVRGLYWVFYSVWMIFFSIISFFIALIAGTPG